MFLVNNGTFLQVDEDIAPTARVGVLRGALTRAYGEAEENQVLLTEKGRQMDGGQVIGTYSAGTEQRPIYVFFRSHLSPRDCQQNTSGKGDRPNDAWIVKWDGREHASRLLTEVEAVNVKPTSNSFQKQMSLAKQLGEKAAELRERVRVLAQQQALQWQGIRAAMLNCQTIFSQYQKHQHLFCQALEAFRDFLPQYNTLLQSFPETLALLRQIPFPPSLSSPPPSSQPSQLAHPHCSVYDWISSHDEKNSLASLAAECERALVQVENEQTSEALELSKSILVECEALNHTPFLSSPPPLSRGPLGEDEGTQPSAAQAGPERSEQLSQGL